MRVGGRREHQGGSRRGKGEGRLCNEVLFRLPNKATFFDTIFFQSNSGSAVSFL